MAANELTLKDVQSILEIIKSAEDIQDFSLKFGGAEIHVSRNGSTEISTSAGPVPKPVAAPVAAAPVVAPTAKEASPQPTPKTSAGDYPPNATLIKSNMVGVFYRAPAPGEPPFVEVGQAVKPDQVLCILEVMKLMNSIASPIEGKVTQILVENGDAVEFGQVMMVIEGAA